MSNPFADISSLGAVEETPTSYWDDYATPTEGGSLVIPAGKYEFKIPDPGNDFKPGKTKENVFAYVMNPVVHSGQFAGKQLNFVRASIRKYSNRNGSQAGDLLVSAGVEVQPRTVADWQAAALELTGRTFRALVDNRVYDKQTSQDIFRSEADIRARGFVKPDGSIYTKFVLTSDGQIVFDADPQTEALQARQALDQGGRTVFVNSQIVRYLPPVAAE